MTTDADGPRPLRERASGERILGRARPRLRGPALREVLRLAAPRPGGAARRGPRAARSRALERRLPAPGRPARSTSGVSVTPLATGEAAGGGYLVVFQDLTEIRRLEQEVRTKEKLAAVGEMAAQLAHEIRNPLGSISGSAQVLMGEPALGDEQGQLLEIISRESKRLSDTLNRFLFQARPSAPAARAGRPAAARRGGGHAAAQRPGGAARPRGRVRGGRGARTCAWPTPTRSRRSSGTWPATGSRRCPRAAGSRSRLRRGSGEVVLTVRDEGRGMGRDEQRRMFEPFRTSGAMGTGLGLAIVYRIVREHGGDIEVRSAPGQGAPRSTCACPSSPSPARMSGRAREAAASGSPCSPSPRRSRPPSPARSSAPRVFFERDILSYWYPGMAVFRRAVAEGAWPLWNPHVGFGAPLLADASFQLAYPPTWLALVLPLAVYYKLFAAGHCLWAAVGRLRPRPAGSACRAARRRRRRGAFALSGPLLSAASLFHHYAGRGLDALGARGARGVSCGGPGLGSAGRARPRRGRPAPRRLGRPVPRDGRPRRRPGSPGTWRARARRRRGVRSPRPAASSSRSGSAAALGAVQWLPTAEQALRGGRAPARARRAPTGRCTRCRSSTSLVPRLVAGAPLSPAAREALFEGRAPLLACLYVGAVRPRPRRARGVDRSSRGARRRRRRPLLPASRRSGATPRSRGARRGARLRADAVPAEAPPAVRPVRRPRSPATGPRLGRAWPA